MNNLIVKSGSLLSSFLFILGAFLMLAGVLILVYPELLAYTVAVLFFLAGISIWGYASKVRFWQSRVQKIFNVEAQQ